MPGDGEHLVLVRHLHGLIADSTRSSRRAFLLGAAGALAGAFARSAIGQVDLEPTPECPAQGLRETRRETEGPFYTPGTPRRHRLVAPDTPGTRVRLSGRVLTQDCRPVPGALLDFWQADPLGRYDDDGYTLRGHQLADADGGYKLETLKPGAYRAFGYRTPHLHVKVRAGSGRPLTTQLYFPDEPELNSRDALFRDELLLRPIPSSAEAPTYRFDFVLRAGATGT